MTFERVKEQLDTIKGYESAKQELTAAQDEIRRQAMRRLAELTGIAIPSVDGGKLCQKSPIGRCYFDLESDTPRRCVCCQEDTR